MLSFEKLMKQRFRVGDRCQVERQDGTTTDWTVLSAKVPEGDVVVDGARVDQVLVCSTGHGLMVAYVLKDRVSFDVSGHEGYRFEEIYVHDDWEKGA